MPDYTIDAVLKATEVLKTLGKYPRPMTLKEIQHFTGQNKNQVFRVLKTLEDADFAECIEGRWCLSVQLWKLINQDIETKLKRLRRTRNAKKPDAAGAGDRPAQEAPDPDERD